ncbi:IclR family transcriptional regulator [Haloplanus sp. GCM10025708]|uniref:IclR family transcriptional regulator n=1 Tax=Haloplanus sp. GCM10025708 TaxID=3252679 RepID=UPI00360E465C
MKTTRQSLAILEYIEEAGGATTAEIVEEFDLPKSTAYNHINTLYENEYVARFGGKYVVGMKLLGMGESARTRHEAYPLADAMVTELAERVEEGVDFCVLEQSTVYAVFNEVVTPNDPYFRMGRQFRPHTSAAGKAILAKSSDTRVEDVLDRIEMVKLTDHTITSKSEFEEELGRVEKRGYAYTDEEYSDGLRAVAAPVVLPDGRVYGALSVGGPSYRFEGEYYRERIPREVLNAASELEDRIASEYRPGAK